jgi:hypothetical protein
MIKVKGNKAIFSGKDRKDLIQISKDLGLSVQDTFTGMLWDMVMREALNGTFKKKEKSKSMGS